MLKWGGMEEGRTDTDSWRQDALRSRNSSGIGRPKINNDRNDRNNDREKKKMLNKY